MGRRREFTISTLALVLAMTATAAQFLERAAEPFCLLDSIPETTPPVRDTASRITSRPVGPGTPSSTRVGPLDGAEFMRADLTGDGAAETRGGSWSPRYLEVYRFDRSGLSPVLRLFGGDGVQVADLRHDGIPEVLASNRAGPGAHCYQLSWRDVYGWTGRRFELVNERFPELYRSAERALSRTLETYPGDPYLLRRQAELRRILGDDSGASQDAGG